MNIAAAVHSGANVTVKFNESEEIVSQFMHAGQEVIELKAVLRVVRRDQLHVHWYNLGTNFCLPTLPPNTTLKRLH